MMNTQKKKVLTIFLKMWRGKIILIPLSWISIITTITSTVCTIAVVAEAYQGLLHDWLIIWKLEVAVGGIVASSCRCAILSLELIWILIWYETAFFIRVSVGIVEIPIGYIVCFAFATVLLVAVVVCWTAKVCIETGNLCLIGVVVERWWTWHVLHLLFWIVGIVQIRIAIFVVEIVIFCIWIFVIFLVL